MGVLLDTCSFIWLCSDPGSLSDVARNEIDKEAELLLSDASLLEIAIKHSIGKLELPDDPRPWCHEQLDTWQIQTVPIDHNVIFQSASLPYHHRDPFDRLIVASSQITHARLLSPDHAFNDYDVDAVW